MARTRSKPAPKDESTPEPAQSTTKPLPPSTSYPPKLFILPKDASRDARIVTLENPATGVASRYFYCSEKGFYEFTRIAAPKKECKSWLIAGERSGAVELKEDEQKKEVETGIGSGYVSKNADLFIATPIDLLFLILPALAAKTSKDTKQLFLALDDYLDILASSSRHWRVLLSQYTALEAMIVKKVRTVCDTVDAGDETMYRLSHEKLFAVLSKKAERMVKNGLPPSMEEKLVKTVLDVPIMSIRREDSTLSADSIENTAQDEALTPSTKEDSQLSTSTTADSQTTISTTITTPDDDNNAAQPALQTPPEIPHLLRLHTSLLYLTRTYLPPPLHSLLTTHLTPTTSTSSTSPPSGSLPNFTALHTHLAHLSKLKAAASALRNISDNISHKRSLDVDEDVLAAREMKKRKKEDEERKKKTEGRGVKMLKKADTSGMKKMSAFFSKVPKK